MTGDRVKCVTEAHLLESVLSNPAMAEKIGLVSVEQQNNQTLCNT